MAIINFTGFEQGATLSGNGGDDIQPFGGSGGSIQGTTVRTGSYACKFDKITTASCYLNMSGNRASDGTADFNSGSYSTIYVQFFFRYATKPSSGDEQICEVHGTGGDPIAEFRLKSDGTITVYDFNNYGTPVLLATGSTALSANTWYKINLKVVSGSSGSYEVKINETAEISGSRSWAITLACRAVFIGSRRDRNGQSMETYYDDFVSSDSGYITTDYAVKVLKPNANGSTMTWTGGTGSSNYAEVDEIPINDADYVQSPNTGNPNVGLMAMQSMSDGSISGNVLAVKAVTICRESSSGTSSTRIRVRSGSTNSESNGFNHSTTTQGQVRLLETDPNTASAWSNSAVDAVEVGAVEDNAIATRMISAMLYVLYEPVTVVNVTVSATVVSATFSIPAYTVTAIRNNTETPSAQVITASIPAYTVVAVQNTTQTPSVQALTVSIPTYTILAGEVVVSPSAQVLTFSIPTYAVDVVSNITVSPSAQALTFSIPSYSVSTDSNVSVSPSVQILTASIPTYTISVEANVSVSAGVQTMTFSIPSYSPSGSAVISPSVQSLTFSIPSYTITNIANITILPEVFSLSLSIPTYSVAGDYWQNKFSTPATSWSDKY